MEQQDVRDIIRHEQGIRIFTEDERIMYSRSSSNYDTAQEDIEEFHIDYSSGEGAPEPETNRTKNGNAPKRKKKKAICCLKYLDAIFRPTAHA